MAVTAKSPKIVRGLTGFLSGLKDTISREDYEQMRIRSPLAIALLRRRTVAVDTELFFLLRQGEVNFARLAGLYIHFFSPGRRRAVDRALHFGLRGNIQHLSFGKNLPTFVPGHNFIIAGRNIGELE